MRILSRTIFKEIFVSAMLGGAMFVLVLFLQRSRLLFEFLVRNSGTPSAVAYLFALALANFEGYPARHAGIDLDAIREICRRYRQAVIDSGETRNPWSKEHAPQLALPSA